MIQLNLYLIEGIHAKYIHTPEMFKYNYKQTRASVITLQTAQQTLWTVSPKTWLKALLEL